jgi:hypothetical protein
MRITSGKHWTAPQASSISSVSPLGSIPLRSQTLSAILPPSYVDTNHCVSIPTRDDSNLVQRFNWTRFFFFLVGIVAFLCVVFSVQLSNAIAFQVPTEPSVAYTKVPTDTAESAFFELKQSNEWMWHSDSLLHRQI